jgi:membrane protein YdbS with pleckstrin-like domain
MDKIKQKVIWDELVRKAKEEKKYGTGNRMLDKEMLKNPAVIENTDKILSTTKPSQWINFGWFLFAILGCWLVIPILIWLWQTLVVANWSYRFGEKTITERKGVFSVAIVEVNYFRVKSIKVDNPFFYRLVGLSTVSIITSEPFRPYLKLVAVGNGEGLRKFIKDRAIYWRQKMGVKETDFHDF